MYIMWLRVPTEVRGHWVPGTGIKSGCGCWELIWALCKVPAFTGMCHHALLVYEVLEIKPCGLGKPTLRRAAAEALACTFSGDGCWSWLCPQGLGPFLWCRYCCLTIRMSAEEATASATGKVRKQSFKRLHHRPLWGWFPAFWLSGLVKSCPAQSASQCL